MRPSPKSTWRSPLYLKIVRNLFLIFSLFTLALTMIYYRLFNDSLTRQAYEMNVERLTQVKEKTELALQELVNLSYSIAADPSVDSLLGKVWRLDDHYHDLLKLQQRLRTAESASPYLHSMYVFSDVNQKLLLSGATYSLDEFYDQQMIEDNFSASRRAVWLSPREIQTYGQTYSRVVTLLLPMPTNVKKPTDMLIANVSLDALSGLSAPAGAAYDILVVNETGDSLFSSLPREALDTVDWIDAAHASAGAKHAVYLKLAGEDMLITSLSGQINSWQYFAVNRPSDLLHASRLIFRLALFISGALLVCASGASLLIGRRYYRPIRDLSAYTAEKARSGAKAAGSELDAIRQNVADMALQQEKLEEGIARSREALRDHLVIRLLLGCDMDAEQLRAEMQDSRIVLPEPLAALIIHLPDANPALNADCPRETRLYMTCKEALRQRTGVAITFDPRHCVLLFGDGSEAVGRRLAADILALWHAQTGESASAAIGEAVDSAAELSRSYRGAQEALQYAGLAGSDHILHIDDIRAHTESAPELSAIERRINEVGLAVKQGDGALAASRIQETLEALWDCERLGYRYQNILLMRLIDQLMMILMERGIEQTAVVNGNPFGVLAQMTSRVEIIDWFQGIAKQIAAHVASQQQNRMYDSIRRICARIQLDYAQPLSVQELADGVHLNANYVGRVFKEYTGKPVLEYITRVRLDQACQLLCASHLTVGEIAERVGFGTPLNMIRAFKKYLGRTPSEQRDWLRTH